MKDFYDGQLVKFRKGRDIKGGIIISLHSTTNPGTVHVRSVGVDHWVKPEDLMDLDEGIIIPWEVGK